MQKNELLIKVTKSTEFIKRVISNSLSIKYGYVRVWEMYTFWLRKNNICRFADSFYIKDNDWLHWTSHLMIRTFT